MGPSTERRMPTNIAVEAPCPLLVESRDLEVTLLDDGAILTPIGPSASTVLSPTHARLI